MMHFFKGLSEPTDIPCALQIVMAYEGIRGIPVRPQQLSTHLPWLVIIGTYVGCPIIGGGVPCNLGNQQEQMMGV